MNSSQTTLSISGHGSLKVLNDSSLVPLTERIISDALYLKFLMFLIPIAEFFSISGIVANTLNIIVFTKLGRTVSTNISLDALAISNLLVYVFKCWTYTPGILTITRANLPFDPRTISILTGTGLFSSMVRWSAFTTAYISFERRLCILKPLTIKMILTPKTSTVTVMVMLVLTVGPAAYLHIRYKFVWRSVPQLNRTILFVDVVKTLDAILLARTMDVVGLLQPTAAFSVVLVCTVYLAIHLGKASAWRKKATSSKAPENTPQKEDRAIKMVVSIAIVFIVCLTPSAAQVMAMAIFPDRVHHRHKVWQPL